MMLSMKQLLFNKPTTKMELLTTPINRLNLELKKSQLQKHIDRLQSQLRRRGVKLRPRFYLGEDWGCVTQTTNIEVGFYDADPALQELNREFLGWAHNGAVIDYLLRHETGHAFCYAYKLYKLDEFRSLFGVKGRFFDTYPSTDRFKPHPWSRDYVNPNRDHYAQKHPDEDFAETFGVWLDPRSNWKKVYRQKKGALTKLKFVSEIVEHYGDAAPILAIDPFDVDSPVEIMTLTVAEFMEAPVSRYRKRATGFIDPMLKKIGRYSARPAAPGKVLLAELIAAHQKTFEVMLTRNTKITQAQAACLLSKMQSRARAMHLYVPLVGTDHKVLEILSLATTLATRYAITGSVLPKR
jgi:hypothetical protein